MDTEPDLNSLIPDIITQHDTALERAQVLMDGNRWDQALVELRKALASEPESPIAHYWSAVCLYYLDEYDQAKQEAKLAIELYPDLDDAYWMLANIALQQDRHSEGLKAIKVALEMDPENASYLTTKASLLLDNNNSLEALKTVDKALILDPNNHTAGSIKTLALSGLGRHDAAECQAQDVLVSAPDDALSWYQRGVQLFMQGNLCEARHVLLEALRLQPENREAEMMLLKVVSAQRGFFSLFWRWRVSPPKFRLDRRLVWFIGILMVARGLRDMKQLVLDIAPVLFLLLGLFLLFCIYNWSAMPLFRLSVRKGWIK